MIPMSGTLAKDLSALARGTVMIENESAEAVSDWILRA